MTSSDNFNDNDSIITSEDVDSNSESSFENDEPISINGTGEKIDAFKSCASCSTKVPNDLLAKLQSCQHLFCRPCLAFVVETSLEGRIECPKFAHCHTFLLNSDIKKIVTREIYEKYTKRSIPKVSEPTETVFQSCLVPNCSTISELDPDEKSYYCPTCTKLNCLSCNEIHEVPCDKSGKLAIPNENFQNSKIFTQVPESETEEERKLRITWENSWEDLRKKFQNSSSESQHAIMEELSLNAGSLINTQSIFECQICLMEIGAGEGVFLQECLHRFCRECLTGHIQHSEEAEIKCPFRIGNFSCPMTILEREVKSLISDEEHDKILKKSLMAAEMGAGNSVHCASPNCIGWVIVESIFIRSFVCDVCQEKNCIPCKALHDSLTCEEYKNSLSNEKKSADALEELLETRSASRCPKCNVVIIKNGGCDHMTCVACKSHFNWSDGTLWPTHNPDGTPIDIYLYGRMLMNQRLAANLEQMTLNLMRIRGLAPDPPQINQPPPRPTATATAPNEPINNLPPQINQPPPPPRPTATATAPNEPIINPPPQINQPPPPRPTATATAPNQLIINPPPPQINQNNTPQNAPPQMAPPQIAPQNLITNPPPSARFTEARNVNQNQQFNHENEPDPSVLNNGNIFPTRRVVRASSFNNGNLSSARARALNYAKNIPKPWK